MTSNQIKSSGRIVEYNISEHTSDDHLITVGSFETHTNTNYLVSIEGSAKNINGLGGASFVQVKRVTNDANTLTVSPSIENGINTTIPDIFVNITNYNNDIVVAISGVTGMTIDWFINIRIISSN